jgi:hypothetical protein
MMMQVCVCFEQRSEGFTDVFQRSMMKGGAKP